MFYVVCAIRRKLMMNVILVFVLFVTVRSKEQCDVYEFCDADEEKHFIYTKAHPEIPEFQGNVIVEANVSCPRSDIFCSKKCCRIHDTVNCTLNESDIRNIEVQIAQRITIERLCHCGSECITMDVEGVPLAYTIGSALSVFFLIIIIAVYIWIEHLRNLPGKILLGYVSSLLLTQLFHLPVQILLLTDGSFCILAGYIMQFSLLSMFFWLNVTCFNLWSTFIGHRSFSYLEGAKDRKRFLVYCSYSWGCAFVITIITFIIDNIDSFPNSMKPNIGIGSCFFAGNTAKFYYFYSFISVILAINLILFVHMVFVMIKRSENRAGSINENSTRTHNKKKLRFHHFLKLAVVMGISWLAEVVSFYHGEENIFYDIMDVVNVSQGILLFIVFVCTPKTIKLIKAKLVGSEMPTSEKESFTNIYSDNGATRLNDTNRE